MKAAVLHQIGQPLVLETSHESEIPHGEVQIRLKAAALNRRDFWITQGLYPKIKLPAILGSDGAGVVTALGAGVDPSWLNQEVVLYPGLHWGDDPRVQSSNFQVLGMPRPGTLATHTCVPVSCLYPKPKAWTFQEAAALPLAGVTAWRGLFTQGHLIPGQTLWITGIGGGVALLAMQWALAAGARVWVTSGSHSKLQQAISMGAQGGVIYGQEAWACDLSDQSGSPDLILDGSGGKDHDPMLEALKPGGRLVQYGATTGSPRSLNLFKLFWKQITLQGSTMGSREEFESMMQFACLHQIRPVIDSTWSLEDCQAAINHLANGHQFGKVMVQCA